MPSKQFQFRLNDGSSIHVHAWLPASELVGCVQIIHGMAEHGGRYDRFAQALNAAGYAVYAQDLPGHGQAVSVRFDRSGQ